MTSCQIILTILFISFFQQNEYVPKRKKNQLHPMYHLSLCLNCNTNVFGVLKRAAGFCSLKPYFSTSYWEYLLNVRIPHQWPDVKHHLLFFLSITVSSQAVKWSKIHFLHLSSSFFFFSLVHRESLLKRNNSAESGSTQSNLSALMGTAAF